MQATRAQIRNMDTQELIKELYASDDERLHDIGKRFDEYVKEVDALLIKARQRLVDSGESISDLVGEFEGLVL